MASIEDVQKLAALARISVPDAELETFAKEFDAIIGYIGQLDELTVEKTGSILPYVNVFRADENPHETGAYTEKLTQQFPSREGDSLSVKQIISHD